MRLRPSVGILALVLAACGSAQATSQDVTSAPSGGGYAACAPPGSRTLVSDRQASIYQQGNIVYGCAFRGGHAHRLGSTRPCNGSDQIGPRSLAGVIAAYGIERCGVDTGTAQVVVRRLTDGVVLHSAAATSRVPGPESFQSVGSIVVKPDGAVAWIGQAHSIVGHRALIEVQRIDRRGVAQLDQGPGIAPGSLRVDGSRLSWTHSEGERSATLS